MAISEKNQKRKNKPYQVDLDELNPHPGFATSIFISWDDIADYFDLFNIWELCREGDETPSEFVDVAFKESRNWAKVCGFIPSDEQLVEKENEIIESLKYHWSACNILLDKFSFKQLVDDANDWSHHGAKEPCLFGNPPTPGKALEYFITSLGINFTVYEPFMIPYIENYYYLYDELPEWNYDDIDNIDIIETLFAIQDRKGINTEIDLEDWASKWVFEDAEHPTAHTKLEMEDQF